MQIGAAWCRLVQLGADWWDVVQFGAAWCNSLRFGADWCNLVQLCPAWCNLVQIGLIGETWCRLAQIYQFGETWCSLVQLGAGCWNLVQFGACHDGIQHTTPKSIASAMNTFFASIGKRLADKITTTWLSCNSCTDLPKSQFQLAELEESFVLQQLPALKTNMAIGLDKISARLPKTSAHTIALSVTKLLNLSIKTGKFPKLWKCSEITALFKSGDRTNASNYRPISILPTLSKILEKAVHTQLYQFLVLIV